MTVLWLPLPTHFETISSTWPQSRKVFEVIIAATTGFRSTEVVRRGGWGAAKPCSLFISPETESNVWRLENDEEVGTGMF